MNTNQKIERIERLTYLTDFLSRVNTARQAVEQARIAAAMVGSYTKEWEALDNQFDELTKLHIKLQADLDSLVRELRDSLKN